MKNYLFCILLTFPVDFTVSADQNNAVEAYSPEGLAKCCETTLKNESVNCNALAGGDMMAAAETAGADGRLNFTQMVRQSGASGEQVLAYMFTCLLNNSASEDHSQCCIAANVTEHCMPLCKGTNGGKLDNPKEQLQRLRAFFDERQCSRYLMPALGGQMCHPSMPINDGIQQRFLGLLIGGVVVGGLVIAAAEWAVSAAIANG